MSGAAVRVEGLSQVLTNLRRLGVSLDDLKGAWEPIGRDVAAAISDEAPRGPSGNLAASVRPSRKSSGVTIRVGGVKGVDYAPYVLFGVPSKGMAPNRFDRRGIDKVDLTDAVDNAIDRAIKSAGLG